MIMVVPVIESRSATLRRRSARPARSRSAVGGLPDIDQVIGEFVLKARTVQRVSWSAVDRRP